MDQWEHFGAQHLIALLIITSAVFMTLTLSSRLIEARRLYLIRVLAVLLFVLEITQDVILVHQGWQIRDAL